MSANKMLRLQPILSRMVSRGRQSVVNHSQRRNYWPSRRPALWDPFSEMQRSVDRALREFDRFTPWFPRLAIGESRAVPVVTNVDGQRLYKIEIDLPDFKPEHINVSVKNRVVTIRAKRELESDGCKQLREYSYEYTLPSDAIVEQVRSLLEPNGLLTIEAPLPRLEEAKQEAKEIPVKKE